MSEEGKLRIWSIKSAVKRAHKKGDRHPPYRFKPSKPELRPPFLREKPWRHDRKKGDTRRNTYSEGTKTLDCGTFCLACLKQSHCNCDVPRLIITVFDRLPKRKASKKHWKEFYEYKRFYIEVLMELTIEEAMGFRNEEKIK